MLPFVLFLPQEHDEPILKHLQDIKVKFSDPGQPMVSVSSSHFKQLKLFWFLTIFNCCSFGIHQSFSLEFHFEPNDFFTNTVLTKTYKMRSEPDESDPFSFDGPEIMSCTGWVHQVLKVSSYSSSLNQVYAFLTLPVRILKCDMTFWHLGVLSAVCVSQQLHNWLDKRQERHAENNQEKAEAQGSWNGEDRH